MRGSSLLRRLRAEHAFEHAPSRLKLGEYHVPYSELTGQLLEDRLGDGVRRGERLAVVGASGSGKSSLIECVLGPFAKGVYPVVVPVAVEPADRVCDVREVVGLVVQAIVDQPETDLSPKHRREALEGAAPQRSSQERASLSGTIQATLTGTGLSGALQRQAPAAEVLNRSAASALESLETLLVRIAREDLMPVLVFDDTDRWLSSPGSGRRDVAVTFFAKVLPALQSLKAAMVVAAQPRYFEDPDLRDHLDRVLSDRVDIPSLPSSASLAKVLASRVRHHLEDSGQLQEAIADEAIVRLFELYTREFGGSIRKVIRTVHVSLRDACESGHMRIGPEVVEQAAGLDLLATA